MEENKKIDNATVAAISMALAEYWGENVHDNESGVLTITYVNKHWNNLNKYKSYERIQIYHRGQQIPSFH